jgi:hypothetical protein
LSEKKLPESKNTILDSKLINIKTETDIIKKNRKFQVSNSYPLDFDQLARVLNFLYENRDATKIKRTVIQEETGFADRHVESLISMGTAIGLIKPNRQILSPVGLLVAEHDIFIEQKGTLQWCHYIGAGSYHNLIWFDIFNKLLRENQPMTQEEWKSFFRNELAGRYSKRTLSKGVTEEIEFIVDAYLNRNFSKIGLLLQTQTGGLYCKRYTDFEPLILAAMIYDYCGRNEASLIQIDSVTTEPGAPPVLFGLDATTFRQLVEELHNHGWLRYETTHKLDQIRLKPGYGALEFLIAFYEERPPQASTDQTG